ncbi:MAG TPA: F0F1 ATP synthase subunit epsilon [Xanthobacteraceae bacterium]|nr:F0F1 ATP synthase subunit epsilon [Xanthobacteraceae bacterium]
MATFQLDLVAPDRLTFSGEVDQVDVPGLEGDFGVFAGHAPTIALMRPGILTVYANGAQQQFVVLGGFVEVSPQGVVTVLAETAASVAEFDRAVLAARIAEMETSVKQMPSDSALDRAIEQLDHFRQIDTHLQGTAMH